LGQFCSYAKICIFLDRFSRTGISARPGDCFPTPNEAPEMRLSCLWYIPPVPARPDDRQFKVGDKVRVNLHHGKIEDAVVRAVIQDGNEIKVQVEVVGIDLTALIDTRQVVE